MIKRKEKKVALKACVYCGFKNLSLRSQKIEGVTWFFVFCRICAASGPRSAYEEIAINAYNCRHGVLL